MITTLDNIITCLRDEEFDILYLVCHGVMVNGKPWLWLEDKDGREARTSGEEFAQRINELIKRPRLVVLASCQSAGDSSGETRTAVGPSLAETGIAAVLAMQGNISMQTG